MAIEASKASPEMAVSLGTVCSARREPPVSSQFNSTRGTSHQCLGTILLWDGDELAQKYCYDSFFLISCAPVSQWAASPAGDRGGKFQVQAFLQASLDF